MTRSRQAVPTFASEAQERVYWERADCGAAPSGRHCPICSQARRRFRCACPPLGGDQDRRAQARRALPVADQDVARGEGGVGRIRVAPTASRTNRASRYFAVSISSISFFRRSFTSALSVVPFDWACAVSQVRTPGSRWIGGANSISG